MLFGKRKLEKAAADRALDLPNPSLLDEAGLCSLLCCPQQSCSCHPAQLFGDPLGQGSRGEPVLNPAASALTTPALTAAARRNGKIQKGAE